MRVHAIVADSVIVPGCPVSALSQATCTISGSTTIILAGWLMVQMITLCCDMPSTHVVTLIVLLLVLTGVLP